MTDEYEYARDIWRTKAGELEAVLAQARAALRDAKAMMRENDYRSALERIEAALAEQEGRQ